MNNDEFMWLVFHPDGRLYFATTADDIEQLGAHNRGGPILKVRRPTIEELRKLDHNGGVKVVELGAVPLWSIRHADGRWRTMDTIGMPDWTDDPEKALAFRLREHADTFAADDPDDVRIVPWGDAA